MNDGLKDSGQGESDNLPQTNVFNPFIEVMKKDVFNAVKPGSNEFK